MNDNEKETPTMTSPITQTGPMTDSDERTEVCYGHTADTGVKATTPEPTRLPQQEKTLHNADISGARKNVPDIKVVGNGDMFRLLCKASSQREGWMKSTKACQVHSGCLVQVTTQQFNYGNATYSLAEALAFVPGVKIVADANGGCKMVAG